MVILPLKVHFAVVCAVPGLSKLGKSQVLPLPHSVESVVLIVCVELDPVISLVPSHARALEIVQEVYRCEGVLAEAHNAEALVDDCHRDRRPSCHHCFHQVVVVAREYEHFVTF